VADAGAGASDVGLAACLHKTSMVPFGIHAKRYEHQYKLDRLLQLYTPPIPGFMKHPTNLTCCFTCTFHARAVQLVCFGMCQDGSLLVEIHLLQLSCCAVH